MPIVKIFSVGDGDTFYIKHRSDNFTINDCNLEDDNKKSIVDELKAESKGKGIVRFISSHPDTDHFAGLDYLDDKMSLLNFYCVKNKVKKIPETNSYKRYRTLRDGGKHFYIYKGCSRRWMNDSDEERKSSGINILWPDTSNEFFKQALENAKGGESPNNISMVAHYEVKDGASFCWCGDLEAEFMKNIYDAIKLRHASILFAPHHGRKSGRLPKAWLDDISPKIIVVGEAPSEHLEYYQDYNTLKQNSAGDIVFDCDGKKIHIYCGSDAYSEDFLDDEGLNDCDLGYYIGSLSV